MANVAISELPEADLPLDGTEDTVIVQDGATKRCSTQDIADVLGIPKEYRAVASQTGTSAPTVATPVKNSLSGAIVYTRSSTGIYVGTLAGAFPAGKTWFNERTQYLALVDKFVYFVRFNDDSFNIFVKTAATDTFVDLQYSDLVNVSILVYP